MKIAHVAFLVIALVVYAIYRYEKYRHRRRDKAFWDGYNMAFKYRSEGIDSDSKLAYTHIEQLFDYESNGSYLGDAYVNGFTQHFADVDKPLPVNIESHLRMFRKIVNS